MMRVMVVVREDDRRAKHGAQPKRGLGLAKGPPAL
jgi:hypothetical protein